MEFLLLVSISFCIFLLNIKICYGEYNVDYLSRDTTLGIRGMAAILILLHHISQRVSILKIFLIFNYIGFILVALFFFLSGYGLKLGVNNKKNYLDKFLIKHIILILLPFWLLGVIRVIFQILNGNSVAVNDLLRIFFGIYEVWFIAAILIFYFLFWIAYRFFKKSLVILFGELFLYIIICQFIGVHSSWSASVLAFPLGILWADYKSVIEGYIRYKYIYSIFGSSILFGGMFTGRLMLMVFGISNSILHCILRNIISCSFVFFLMIILQKMIVKKGLLSKIGKMSYEIYIVHYVFLKLIEINLYLFLIITVSITFIVAICSKRIFRLIFIKYMLI